MREAAEEHEHVLDDPAPILSFEGFGDNSLTLILRAYLELHRLSHLRPSRNCTRRSTASSRQAGIVIAFPQRDLHLGYECATPSGVAASTW